MNAIRHIAIAVLLTGTMWAQEKAAPTAAPALPKDLPKAGELKPPSSPTVDQQKLKNGLTVWLVQRPELPKVAFKLVVRGGDSYDPEEAPGLAKLMARAVTQGTTTRSSRDIAEAAQGAGGDLTSAAVTDFAEISLDALSEHAGDAVTLLADIAQNANFPESEVALTKSNMQDELRASEARPGFLARRAWYDQAYGSHPYHIYAASMKTLESAKPQSLKTLYQQEFRPDNAILVAVGSFDKAALMPQIEKAFGGWAGSGKVAEAIKPPDSNPPHKIFYIERPGSVQTTMLIGGLGLNAHDPEKEALEVADTIYGGSFGSRLTRNIREDKGYTYTPFSFITANRLGGVCLTGEDVRNDVTGPSLKETFYELKRISTEPPSDAEMQQAKRYLIGNTALELQSRTAVAETLGRYWVNDESATHLNEEMANIQKTTAQDAAKVATKYFNPDRMLIIAVGEKNVILDQLKPFNMEIAPAPQQ
jgi:predicted Zn-dependent peptidase